MFAILAFGAVGTNYVPPYRAFLPRRKFWPSYTGARTSATLPGLVPQLH